MALHIRCALIFWLLSPLLASAAPPVAPPKLGVALTEADIAQLRPVIFPDGKALPPGSGSVAEGARVYAKTCLACHGLDGRGGPGGELAGGVQALDSKTPDKTIGTYWPYATTLFDFIRRAMPLNAPGSLSDGEVYALTAYLLHLNELLDASATLDAASLTALRMPNRDGFIWIDVPKKTPPPH